MRLLGIVAVLWFLCVLLYLFAAVPYGAAAPVPGTDDVVCGVWTFYAPGVAERARSNHGLTPCAGCTGLGITVDQSLLGRTIEIRHAGQWHGPFHVIDVGSGHHRPGLVGEIDYQTAMAWRIAGPWRTCYRLTEAP